MKGWSTAKLGDVLTKATEQVEADPAAEYSEVTVKLWGKGVVERKRVLGSEVNGRRFVARAGNFIASRIDARNGAMGLVPDSLEGALVTNDFPLFEADTGRLELTYLGWLCRTRDFVELCLRASEGTTNRVRLKEDRFLALEIPLPPLAEQRRIVARIEALAAQIDEAKRLRQEAVEEAEALVDCKLSHLEFGQEQPDQVPIRDVSTMSTGTTPPSGRLDYYGGDVQWYTPGDLSFTKRVGASTRTLSASAVSEGKARVFEPSTVLLVAIGASLGKVALTHASCSANQQITGIKFGDEIDPEYGFWWMRGLRHQLMEAAPQATLPIINQSRIGEFRIAVPSLPEQRRIVAELDALQEQVDALKRLQAGTAAELDALLPAILDRAFKGEL